MNKCPFVIIFSCVVLISGCGITGNTVFEKENHNQIKILSENNDKNIEAYFCPEDRCDKKLFDRIYESKQSVHCAFFDLDLKKIIQLLELKHKYGFDIKVVVDDYNKEDLENYSFIKFDTSSQYSHNKFCIIDNNIITTGSFNPTDKGAFFNNNNLIIIESKLLAENYEQEFKELWQNMFGEGSKVKNPEIKWNKKRINNYFCPEDRCGDRIYAELMKAKNEIYFMIFSFTHGKIANALVMKKKEGLDIKGVLEKSQNSRYNKKPLLEYQNISVKWDRNKYNMHHKTIIIDKKIVITGSFNPSNNADKNNDENIIIIEDEKLAERYLEEFESIWNYVIFEDKIKEAENIVIDEIMYDPEGKDTDKEYIYLHNTAEKEIDIDYWKLSNNRSTQVLKGKIKAKGYKKILPSFSLKNKDGLLILMNLGNKQVDYAAWEGRWNISSEPGKPIFRRKNDKVNCEEQWTDN